MTLNITIMTKAVIHQSSDFRLTDPESGRTLTDKSAKYVGLTYREWHGFVTYTGVGSWRGQDVSSMVVDWLQGQPEPTFEDVASVLAERGTKLIEDIRVATERPRCRHTFVLAGFVDREPSVAVISNFQGTTGRPLRHADPSLVVTSSRLPSGRKAVVLVTGCSTAVSIADRKLLQRLARTDPENGTRIRQRLGAVTRRSANASTLISRGCSVASLRADGGSMQFEGDGGDRPGTVPNVSHGLDLGKALVGALAAAGLDLSAATLVQAASSRSVGSGPVQTMAAPSCRFVVASISDQFTVEEFTSSAFEIQGATAISDTGHLAGNGWLPGRKAPWEPWVWHDGEFRLLGYPGVALGVNDHGDVAGTVHGGAPERAVLYSDGVVRELMANGFRAIDFVATRSTARAVGGDRIVVGNVRDADNTKPNTRAAAFFPDGTIRVAVDVPSPHGSDALRLNEDGLVLVVAVLGPGNARAIIWDLASDTWRFVGDPNARIHPVGITASGTVLGQARSAPDLGIAMTCPLGGSWERLGTEDGLWPVDINDSGDVVGYAKIDGLQRPWLYRAPDGLVWLPYVRDHHTTPTAINNNGVILGSAGADHGGHTLLWREVH